MSNRIAKVVLFLLAANLSFKKNGTNE